MYIDRTYHSKYRRRPRWPIILALLLIAGAVLVAIDGLKSIPPDAGGVPGQIANNPLNPFKPPTPAPTPTRSAVSYLAEAEDHYKAGKLTAASQSYARAAELEPKNDEAFRWQAWLLILRGRPADAVPLARKAVELKDSGMNLGVLAMALDWTEKYDEALEAGIKAIDKEPMLAEAHAFLAEVYADRNEWRGYEEAQAAVKLDPNSPIAQRNLGYVLERQGRYKDAVEVYQKAAELAPNLGYIHVSAGNTYMAAGDFENALAEYQKAADANPDSPAGYDALGHGASVAGDPERGIDNLKKAIETDPTYGMAYAHLGSAYYTRLNYEKAIENFQKAVDLGVRSEQHFYQFGLAYIHIDDCQNGAAWLQKALEINPDSRPAQDGLQLCQGDGKKKK